MRRGLVALASVAALGVGVVGATWPAHAADEPAQPCHDAAVLPHNVVPYRSPHGYRGYVGFPHDQQTPPKALVVFFHGYGHTARNWATCHLGAVADAEGVITVAMADNPADAPGGWRVREEAAAAVDAATDQQLRRHAPQVIAYGVSMGGDSSGLAVAGAPGVFDWWVDVEGATNVLETYLEASALAPANDFASKAKADIEAEMGGTPAAQPDAYRQADIVARSAEVKASGIAGVAMCHGVADGLVPYDQSRELWTALRALGMPVDMTTFVTRPARTEHGTTIDGYVPGAPDSPFAGHADEDSVNQVVGLCGFHRLHDILTDHFDGTRDELNP